MMEKKYLEKAEVLNIKSIAEQDVEAVITLDVRGHIIECFADLTIQSNYHEGSKYDVELYILFLNSIKK